MDLAGGGDSGGVRVLSVYGVYGGGENGGRVKALLYSTAILKLA